MVVRIHPLPDELDRSYLGALMRVNAFSTEAEARTFLTAPGDSALPWRQNPTLKLLSDAAGMELEGFVMNHTTLPLRRSVTSYMPGLPHGSPGNLVLLHVSGKRSCRDGAYLCQDCVWEDVDFHGRSYWRRAHQLPGTYWCAKHRGALSVVEDESAFLQPPSQMLGRARRLDGQWVESLQRNPAVERFLDLCDVLMDRPAAYPVAAVRNALRASARRHGFQSYATQSAGVCKDPLLSDALVEAYPASWLAQLVPGLPSKTKGVIWHQVDGVLWTATSASAAVIYILALALLFESAPAATDAVDAEATSFRQPTRSRRKVVDDYEARETYIQAHGSHARMRRNHVDDWLPLIQAQQRLGLPGLPYARSSKLWDALDAFCRGRKSLEEALAMCAPHQDAFEKILRGAAEPLSIAIEEMAAPRSEVRRGRRRTRAGVSSLDVTGLLEPSGEGARGTALDAVPRETPRANTH